MLAQGSCHGGLQGLEQREWKAVWKEDGFPHPAMCCGPEQSRQHACHQKLQLFNEDSSHKGSKGAAAKELGFSRSTGSTVERGRVYKAVQTCMQTVSGRTEQLNHVDHKWKNCVAQGMDVRFRNYIL